MCWKICIFFFSAKVVLIFCLRKKLWINICLLFQFHEAHADLFLWSWFISLGLISDGFLDFSIYWGLTLCVPNWVHAHCERLFLLFTLPESVHSYRPFISASLCNSRMVKVNYSSFFTLCHELNWDLYFCVAKGNPESRALSFLLFLPFHPPFHWKWFLQACLSSRAGVWSRMCHQPSKL